MKTSLFLNSAAGGIGNALKTLAGIPAAEQSAKDERELALAKIYGLNASGRKDNAAADQTAFDMDVRRGALNDTGLSPSLRKGIYYGLQGNIHDFTQAVGKDLTNNNRAGVESYIEKNRQFSDALKNSLRLFGFDGKTDIGKTAGELQQQGFLDKAITANDPTVRNVLLSAGGRTAYAPVKSIGDSGYTIDEGTGAISAQNQILAKIFAELKQSAIKENNAQAYQADTGGAENKAQAALANAHISEINDGGKVKIDDGYLSVLGTPVYKTDRNGKPTNIPETNYDGKPVYSRNLEEEVNFLHWAKDKGYRNYDQALVDYRVAGNPRARKDTQSQSANKKPVANRRPLSAFGK